MRGTDRQLEVKNYIRTADKVSVAELAGKWNITEETVRRDLDKLEEQGFITRVRGGAIWNESIDRGGVWFFERQRREIDAKKKIARTAESLIRSADTIFADASSTVLEALRVVYDQRSLKVVTNGSGALVLPSDTSFQLISTGGIYNRNSMSFQGEPAAQMLRRYHVDLAVISCVGIDRERGVMDSNDNEASIKRVMVAQADRVAVLADHTKFGRLAFLHLIDFSEASYLITDEKPDDAWIEYCEQQGIQLMW
ncbi:DeoR/GlpR family DNA-binding transcription regulator [Collinsella sp. zg1085]|uniref:DeoR/GlpR family DNA-binding transcription regulator n=1 Tax=Collinsella sp. zg1085 TaxID=2844380 RepID=UPI001C0BF3EB|nr:DeoR/GlpR family DNA-binding transcription regulator [Collinsella sp. zg1085]QWT18080.1 DeoR/GlpR family DNA-binding transcription regulator [Collinsella sp. zg1085]